MQRPDLEPYVGQQLIVQGWVVSLGTYVCLKDVRVYPPKDNDAADQLYLHRLVAFGEQVIPTQDHVNVERYERSLLRLRLGDAVTMVNATVTRYGDGETGVTARGSMLYSIKRIYHNGTYMVEETVLRPSLQNHLNVMTEQEREPRGLFFMDNAEHFTRTALGFALERMGEHLAVFLHQFKPPHLIDGSWVQEVWKHQGKPPTQNIERLTERWGIFLRRIQEGRVAVPTTENFTEWGYQLTPTKHK